MNDPMRLVHVESAAEYLRDTGRLADGEPVQVTELTGGVSNVVLLVQRQSDQPDFVLKQARGQLRVAEPWFCSVERIWRETEVLLICQGVLDRFQNQESPGDTSSDPTGAIRATTPKLLFADQDNYLFAMTAAPDHQVWKQHLLAGIVQPAVARACGDLLGQLHAGTWCDAQIAEAIGDRTFFDDLRLKPYYRRVAELHPGLQPPLNRLADSVEQNCCSLVHGDFSPKNLLVFDGQLMLVDFEVGHYGDPAFDLGFFLSHLVLKSLAALPVNPDVAGALLELTVAFWSSYRARMIERVELNSYDQLVRRAIQHFAGCALARVDGKSPVDYLRPTTQDVVRRITAQLLISELSDWDQALAAIASGA